MAADRRPPISMGLEVPIIVTVADEFSILCTQVILRRKAMYVDAKHVTTFVVLG